MTTLDIKQLSTIRRENDSYSRVLMASESETFIELYCGKCIKHGRYTLRFNKLTGEAKCIYHDLPDIPEEPAEVVVIDEYDGIFDWWWKENGKRWRVFGQLN